MGSSARVETAVSTIWPLTTPLVIAKVRKSYSPGPPHKIPDPDGVRYAFSVGDDIGMPSGLLEQLDMTKPLMMRMADMTTPRLTASLSQSLPLLGREVGHSMGAPVGAHVAHGWPRNERSGSTRKLIES